jgi:DEAD/DEAH box helicase domain-containing protein
MHTTSYWFTVPWSALDTLDLTREQIQDGLMGLGYCLHQIAPIWLMCDVRDIDHAIGDKSGQYNLMTGKVNAVLKKTPEVPLGLFDPTIFIFDAYPGGIGFSELLFEMHENILAHARTLINACACENGCPSCVGPRLEVGPDAKTAALSILKILI